MGTGKITGLGKTKEHLKKAIELGDEDPETLHNLALNHLALDSEIPLAKDLLFRAMHLYLDSGMMDSVIEAHREYRNNFMKDVLEPKFSIRIAKELRKRGLASEAARELETSRIYGDLGKLKDGALFLEAMICEKDLGLKDHCSYLYKLLLKEFPESDYAEKAKIYINGK